MDHERADANEGEGAPGPGRGRRTGVHDDDVLAGLDADGAEDRIGALDGRGQVVDGRLPAGRVGVEEDNPPSALRDAHPEPHAVLAVLDDLDRQRVTLSLPPGPER